MISNDFDDVRTLIRAVDISGLAHPDVEQAIHSGRRRRRIAAVDRALAGGVVLAIAAAGVIWAAQGATPSAAPGKPLTSATTTAPTSSPSAVPTASEVITAKVGDAVAVDDTGLLLRLAADGFCEESAPGRDVPLGPCRTLGDPNDPTGEGVSRGAWDGVQVLTGLAPTDAAAAIVTRVDGRDFVGTLVKVEGHDWQAFYVVMPWHPATKPNNGLPSTSDIASVSFKTEGGATIVRTR